MCPVAIEVYIRKNGFVCQDNISTKYGVPYMRIKWEHFQESKNRGIDSESVEKVPEQILGGDAEKNDLTECGIINDLTITRGHQIPQNHSLSILKVIRQSQQIQEPAGF